MKFLAFKLNKKVMIGIIGIIIVVGGVTTNVVLKNDKKDTKLEEKQDEKKEQVSTDVILKDNLEFEIHSELHLLSLISDNNKVNILSKDEIIDTTTLGAKEIHIKYESDGQEKAHTFQIKIVDTKAPIITSQDEISTTVGTKIDLLKGVKANDNSKEEIKIDIEGRYDFNKEGLYRLKYVAHDSSNNKTEKDFTLKVTGEATNPSTNSNNVTQNEVSGNKPNSSISNETNKDNDQSNSPNRLIHSATHKYKLNYHFAYVKQTSDFYAKNKQDMINIFYTALNEGADHFSFYCTYDNCENEFEKLAKDGSFQFVQSFVHPYNTYNSFSSNMLKKENETNVYITVKISKRYSSSDIAKLENKVNSIINATNSMSISNKIKALHDYIINNTKYTSTGNPYEHTALGPLLNGKSVCEGYAHTMAILLNKLNIPNYRIFSDSHEWNLVYVNSKWLHIDVTWDDPVASDGNDYLFDTYYLIDTAKIKSLDPSGQHNFNASIFKEA